MSAIKKALVFGITGQDGTYLSEILLDKGYEVHGVKRRTSLLNTDRIDHLFSNPNFHLHYGDLTDTSNVISLVAQTEPDEIYNLAAQSHVAVSFETPEYTANCDALGTLRILEAIRILKREGHIRFYQASTSELYGLVQETPQSERTPFYPRSPYATAKLFSFWTVRNYRESYGIYASNGILFNHESPLRGETFVTRKITRFVAQIALGKNDVLKMGNLNALRDWGHARDFCEAIYAILQQPKSDDYVIATGEQHSIREFIELAFSHINIQIAWRGEGLAEEGYDAATGRVLVGVHPRYFRPNEVETLLGDATKARTELGWKPRTSFPELVAEMVAKDIEALEKRRKFAR